ncbi:MAG: galactose mutarotase [Bacteroidia bacterium]|nr:galactose mutarotase [Bacteroidia bacterium]
MNKVAILLLLAFNLLTLTLFGQVNSSNGNGFTLKSEQFQKVINGKQVGLYFLENGPLKAAITNYGARIVSLCVPSKNAEMADVVVGFKSIDDYLNAKGIYHGAIVGRVAGRIANGKFDLNGSNYSLPLNSPPNQLHGGVDGFHNQVWDVSSVSDSSITLTYLSVDGEMGFPGNLKVNASYTLTSKNELILKLDAVTDKSTPVNLTNHAFFNLAGEGSGTILNHILTINSKYICTIDQNKLPTGKFIKVNSSPFDFRKPKTIGKDLSKEKSDDQLKVGGGYDHHFVLSFKKSPVVKLVATVVEPLSGRKMEVFTNEPCIHLFTANFFNGSDIGKLGKPINFRESFALETQRFPFAPDQNKIPPIILNPGVTYEATTILRFSTVN